MTGTKMEQLMLWGGFTYIRGVHVHRNQDGELRCPGCDQYVKEKELRESLWGYCRRCENDRIQDVVVG